MNKKTKLLIVSILSIGLCASAVFIVGSNITNLTFASIAKPVSLDCSWYFNNEEIEYKSLYELNVARLNGNDETATTWGTVTDTFYNKAGTVAQQFIQSTDKYGNVGATCLYNINSAQVFPIGSVVTVTGTMTLFNGMSEMKECKVTKDYDSNPSPVESMKINGLPTRTDSDFTSYRYMGTRKVNLTNVSLGEITSSRQCYATLDNSKQVLLFFNSISEQTAINNKITSIRNNGSKADVKGYVTCYSNNNTGTPSLQVLIRHADDIQEVVVPEKEIDYLEVTTDKNFYYMDNITMSDFTATIFYKDETSEIVNDAYIVEETIDTTSTGIKTVHFAYERNGVTYEDQMDIYIYNTIASISVEDPIQYYAYGETFKEPTVIGHSYDYDMALNGEVDFDGFDSYQIPEYNGNIDVKYTNSAGRVVSTFYEYYVSHVETVELVNFKTEYEIGEAFVYPDVIVDYTAKQNVSIDKSRVQFSGFDSSTPGTVYVTVSYGDWSDDFAVTIIDNTPAELYEYNVSISNMGTYNTGNYGTSGDFEYYRAVKETGYLCKLIPLTPQPGCEPTLDGALYNINPIKDIDHITFTYKTSSSSGVSSPKLFYGENSYDSGSVSINYSTSIKETTIDFSSYDVNYIKFTCGDSTLYLEDIAIYYSGESTPHGYNFVNKTTGVDEYRIAPVTYSGALVDGESYVDVPVAFDVTHSTVTAYKRYTYYSYEYVNEHQEYISDATITSPVDVCNYFEAFGCAPANFGAKSTFSLRDGKYIPTVNEVNALFGSDARTISKYSKTTGYATSVPFYGSTPTYYELDIDTNGKYKTSDRQSGRIVAWATGFTGSDYGNGSQCVCVYTDDHYATFKEYNNFGGFMSRFNVERRIAGATRGNPTTL